MLVDLILKGRKVLIIGRGYEVEFRAKQFSAEGAEVAVVSGERLLFSRWKSSLKKSGPFLLVIASGNLALDQRIATFARERGVRLVYVVDRPELNDLNMAGIAKIGDIRVAVSTGGKSPAMAGALRRKIESLISPEDVLQVKLQAEIRSQIMAKVRDPDKRKRIIRRLIHDKKILAMLEADNFEAAKSRALETIARVSKEEEEEARVSGGRRRNS